MGEYSSHKTYINNKGVEVPSVTTILKVINKPALVKWANYMGFKHIKTEDVLTKAGAIGTLTHNCIEAYLKNEKFEIPMDMKIHTETLYLRMDGFMNWLKTQTSFEPIMQEEELVADNYGGTVDFYGDMSGKMSIIDFKTSSKVHSTMFLQMAAYKLVLESQGRLVEGCGILHITERGTNLHYKTSEEMKPYEEAFLVLVEFFHKWYDLNKSDGWGNILV